MMFIPQAQVPGPGQHPEPAAVADGVGHPHADAIRVR